MKHNFKKAIAVMLSVIMFSVFTLPTVFAAVDTALLGSDIVLQSEKVYTLIGGVTERDLVVNNKAGNHRNECFVLEVDLSDPNVSIIAGYNDGDADGWGRVPVRTHAEAAEKLHDTNVVGAINGDFHSTKTGEPRGILVMNGVLAHGTAGCPFFAILNDGTAVIRGGGDRTDDVKEAIGGNNILVRNGQNVAPVNKLNPRTAIGIKADGTVVMFVVDGRQDPTSCGMDYPEVAQMMISLGCVSALELDGGGSSTCLAQHEGRTSLSCRNNPSYGSERPVSTSLLVCTSLKATGVFDRVNFSAAKYVCAPYSSVGITARGVDTNGYSMPLPENGRLVLENESLGSLNGSTFRASDKEGSVTVNYCIGDEIAASAVIEVTNAADNEIESIFKKIQQFFFDIINTFKLLIDKFNEKILGKV